jgi:hypothetical protein
MVCMAEHVGVHSLALYELARPGRALECALLHSRRAGFQIGLSFLSRWTRTGQLDSPAMASTHPAQACTDGARMVPSQHNRLAGRL